MILFGERIGAAAAAAAAARSPAASAWPGARAPGCWRFPPAPTGAACARPAPCPTPAPATPPPTTAGRSAAEIGAAAAGGEITALHLFETDPVRDLPDRALWERAHAPAALVVAHASVLTEGLRRARQRHLPRRVPRREGGHASCTPTAACSGCGSPSPIPARSAPAGRCSPRSRARAASTPGVRARRRAFAQLVAAVPFYEGLTLEEIGGRGVRWPARPQARVAGAGAERPAGCGGPTLARRPRSIQRPPAAGHLPADLGLARGRDLAGAQVPHRPSSRSSSRPTTRSAWASSTARPWWWPRTGPRLNATACVRSGVPAGQRLPRRRARRRLGQRLDRADRSRCVKP